MPKFHANCGFGNWQGHDSEKLSFPDEITAGPRDNGLDGTGCFRLLKRSSVIIKLNNFSYHHDIKNIVFAKG